MGELKGKKVLIFQQRGWGNGIGHFLAKKFQAENCELAALTMKKSTHKFISEQTEVKYSKIISIDDIYEYPEKYLDNEEITFEQICGDLEIDSLWPLIYSDRHLVRSYKEKFYYSYRQYASDEYIALFIKAYYKVACDLLKNFKPDLILIPAFIFEGHVILELLSKKYGIPLIAVANAKVPGWSVFVNDYVVEKCQMFDRFDQLNNYQAESANQGKAKKFISQFREKFIHQAYMPDSNEKISLIKKIRSELLPFKRILNWYLKPNVNFIKTFGPSQDYRSPRYILRDHYYFKKYKKFAENFNYYPLERLKKFVFFPLQFTPEASADLICPMFNNQVELARQLAMSLPDDYTLVVKEHPEMVGLRAPAYLKQLQRTANVKVIDYRIPAEAVLKKMELVVANFSTAIFEAALYKKPAIMLGDSGFFKRLPNVIKHSDFSDMAAVIKRALLLDFNTAEYDRRLENYFTAVYDTGFDFDYNKAWYYGGEDLEELWRLYRREIKRVLK